MNLLIYVIYGIAFFYGMGGGYFLTPIVMKSNPLVALLAGAAYVGLASWGFGNPVVVGAVTFSPPVLALFGGIFFIGWLVGLTIYACRATKPTE